MDSVDNPLIRKIIHIDMDSFFASVEMRDNPELRDKPLAVGSAEGRGVVSTANYIARKYGVHSAMSSSMAKRLCPNLVFVPVHYEKYKEVSRQMHEIFHEYTDLIEPISLDEAFLDVTENKAGIMYAVDIAKEIKQKIQERLNLTASAGVSYCKFLAKIASDERKPDGLFVIHPTKAQAFIDKLDVAKIWGVGPVTAEKMHRMGIFKGKELREAPLIKLNLTFGKMGNVYHDFANGIDDRPVESVRIRKSVGCEETFGIDIFTLDAIESALEELTQDLLRRLSKADFKGHTLTVKVKFHDFKQITRSITIDEFYTSADQVMTTALQVMSNIDYADNPIRLLGLSVSNSDEVADVSEKYRGWVQLTLDFEEDS